MTLTLDLDTVLSNITTLAGGISGIRHAYNYDAWPDSPPGMFNRNQAMHLTGFLEEGDGWRHVPRGMDMTEFELTIPLYTIVIAAAQVKRSRSWVAQYIDSYPALFRANMLLSGAIPNGSAIYRGGRVVRRIPDWPGYDDFYMLRHELEIHSKGHVTNAA